MRVYRDYYFRQDTHDPEPNLDFWLYYVTDSCGFHLLPLEGDVCNCQRGIQYCTVQTHSLVKSFLFI